MSNFIDIMIDLETVGTEVDAPVLSIGAVAFCIPTSTIESRFFVAVDPASAFASGKPDAKTIQWWMKQSPEAQIAAWDNPYAEPIRVALQRLDDYLNSFGKTPRVWGNAARFDLGILDYQYKKAGMELPWKFYNEMCYRSLKNSYRHHGLKEVQGMVEGTAHTALYDAEIQALHAMSIAHAHSIESLINGIENDGRR